MVSGERGDNPEKRVPDGGGGGSFTSRPKGPPANLEQTGPENKKCDTGTLQIPWGGGGGEKLCDQGVTQNYRSNSGRGGAMDCEIGWG